MKDVDDKVWQGNELSQRYLTGVRGAIPLAQEQMDVMLRLVRWSQEEVTTVLDLGCGNGVLGQVILDQYPQASGIFADFSEPMLAAARLRLSDYEERASLVQVDYAENDWVKALRPSLQIIEERSGRDLAQFDVIVSGFSIHHQPDKRKQTLYSELFEMLAPGGIFINVEHVSSQSKWGEMLFEEAFLDSMMAYHQQIDSNHTRGELAHDFYNRPDKDANILAPVEAQCRWLRDIGFIHVDCYLKYFELAVFAGVRPAW